MRRTPRKAARTAKGIFPFHPSARISLQPQRALKVQLRNLPLHLRPSSHPPHYPNRTSVNKRVLYPPPDSSYDVLFHCTFGSCEEHTRWDFSFFIFLLLHSILGRASFLSSLLALGGMFIFLHFSTNFFFFFFFFENARVLLWVFRRRSAIETWVIRVRTCVCKSTWPVLQPTCAGNWSYCGP